jgi:cell division protein FtsL
MAQRTTLIALLIAAVLGVSLFLLKYQVRGLESRLNSTNREIVANREAIHVLHAEWAHLNEPDRLASLATRLLQLQPVTPDRIATVASLPMADDAHAAALAAASTAKPPATAAKKNPTPPQAQPQPPAAHSPAATPARGPAIAQSNDDADALTRLVKEALADGRSPR